MAKHMVKCLICGQEFDASEEQYTKVGKRYVHKDCFEHKEEMMSKEQKDKNALYEFIKELFKLPFVPPRIIKQTEDYKRDYGFSYSGMQKALYYFYIIKGNSIEKANGGCGILPYIYQEAYNYYYALYKRNLVNEQKDFVAKEIEIVISQPKRHAMRRKKFTFLEE